jgi:hypothetical protein
MVHGYRRDLMAALIQRVDELDVAMPAQAENLRHLLLDQIIDNDLGAIERVSCHWFLLTCSMPQAPLP